MKKLSDFLVIPQFGEKRDIPHKTLDEKTVFFIAKRVIEHLFGKRGVENITPKLYRNKTLYLSVSGSLWANELWYEKNTLREQINKELEQEEVGEIKVAQ